MPYKSSSIKLSETQDRRRKLTDEQPERAKTVKERIKKHWRDYRPSKEEWAQTMREHRHYKQELYLKGELQ